MRSVLKKIIFGLAIAGVIFVLLNFSYIVKNLRFSLAPHQSAVPSSTTDSANPAKAEPDTIWIESLDIKAPLRYVDEINEQVFQEALQQGVVHYPGTALPGQEGNAYYFGHSSDYALKKGDYKTVFALLPRIENGAEIKVTGTNGILYTYTVIDQFVVAPNDTEVLDQKENKYKLLTLQTSYPVGTALKRYIVVAELKQ